MVNVYITDVSKLPDPAEYPEVMQILPKDRIEKIMKFRQVKDRKESLGAGLLLFKVLEKHGRCLEQMNYGLNGKPRLKDIEFNLSHSHNLVVCAISEKPVGIDVERIKDAYEHIADRFFTPTEVRYLAQYAGETKRSEFFRLWTMKESYMKMTGEGMKLALDRFEFHIEDEINVYRDGKKAECFIKEYHIPEYKLTVCAKEKNFSEQPEYISI